MRRHGKPMDSFAEPIDLNRGSNTENSASFDGFLNPGENQSSRYVLSNSEGNVAQMDVPSEFVQRFSGWDCGESSSRTNYEQEQGESSVRLGCSSFHTYTESDACLIDWSPELRNISVPRHPSSHAPARYSSSSNLFNSTSNTISLRGSDNHGSLGEALRKNEFCDDQHESDGFPGFFNTDVRMDDCSGPSLSTWGSSCKRKALEGSASQFLRGGSSAANQTMEKNLMQDPFLRQNISPENLNLTLASQLAQVHPSQPFGSSGVVAPGFFQTSNVSRMPESSARNPVPISSHGHRSSVTFDAPRGHSLRSVGICIARPSRHSSTALDSRSTVAMDQSNPVNPSFPLHIREIDGSSSASFPSSGERRRPPPHAEVSVRSSRRTNPEFTMTVSVPETGTLLQDHVDWSFSSATSLSSSSSRNPPSVSHVGSTSGARSSTLWWPHPVQTPQHHQRVSEGAHLNPYVVLESGTRRAHRSLNYPSPIPSNGGTTSSRSRHRSSASSQNLLGGDVFGLDASSGPEGRHRLIQQLLNAMRRDTHINMEDYMLIEPFLAEFHDSYRGMRLDVDNMSYEELLALGERIGSVSTGLSEEKIAKNMKHRKQESTKTLEPCCICQEDYTFGDDIGVLDCQHEFHSVCIKQWLKLKNLCPICKMTALGS